MLNEGRQLHVRQTNNKQRKKLDSDTVGLAWLCLGGEGLASSMFLLRRPSAPRGHEGASNSAGAFAAKDAGRGRGMAG